MKFLVINGPNLNMLGTREPSLYGAETYKDLTDFTEKSLKNLGIECEQYQTNYEGKIIDLIQEAPKNFDGIIINPGGYTHTSVSILDALKSVPTPAVEVHLTDIDSREPFRKISFVRLGCIKTVMGLGFEGYNYAAKSLKQYIEENS